jgi:hypothetical protein
VQGGVVLYRHVLLAEPADSFATKGSPLWQMAFFTYLGRYATGNTNADFYIIGTRCSWSR